MLPIHSTFIIILGVLILFSAFFSASETALIALNKVRLRHMIENKRPGAKRIYGILSRMDKFIATILVANNLCNTAIATISTAIMTYYFGVGEGLVYATLLITAFIVIFCDLIPKVFATSHPEGVAFFARHILAFMIFLLTPITRVLTWISSGIIRAFGGNPHHRSPLVTEEEIKMMVQIGKEEGYYGDNERKMLERIFHFDEIEVREIMTPLQQVAAIEIDMAESEIERILLEEGHNRIPVYRKEKTDIIGIIYVRDLLYIFKNSELIHLSDLMSQPFFISPKQKAAELLKEFQRRKIQIAIVRDPVTDKALGLVTLEDLLEEIVGEIEEEIDASLTK